MEIEDLLQKAAALFPAYLRDLLAVLTGPKRFVARRQSERSSLEHATVFLAISVAINFVLKIPLTQENPAWGILRTAAFSFVLWLSAGVVIWIACRVVGGTGALDRTLAIAFYYFGVLEYVMALTALLLIGTVRTIDRATFDLVSAALRTNTLLSLMTDTALAERLGMRVALLTVWVGAVVAFVWMIAGWGAFRTLHKLHRRRSAAACIVAAVLCVPLTAMIGLVASALVATP